MSDIVERLMLGYRDERMTSGELHKTAAEEITKLREALQMAGRNGLIILKELDDAKAEIAELKAERQARELQLCGMYQPNPLASCQAREAKLRNALREIIEKFDHEEYTSVCELDDYKDILAPSNPEDALFEFGVRVAEAVRKQMPVYRDEAIVREVMRK